MKLSAAIPALLLAFATFAFADGGGVLTQEIVGPYRVTLFGSPLPLRAGPADLSVMLQDARTGEAVLDRAVTIKVDAAAEPGSAAWVPPCCSMKTDAGTVAATHAAAQNKLLYAANVLLPASGRHDVTIRVGDGEEFLRTRVDVAAPLAPPATYWAFLAFPPLAIVGFALNQRIRRRKN